LFASKAGADARRNTATVPKISKIGNLIRAIPTTNEGITNQASQRVGGISVAYSPDRQVELAVRGGGSC
jgi:hypothetical protein